MKRMVARWLLVCGLLAVALAAGCGSDRKPANPYALLETPGPPPPARPGSQVWGVGMPLLVVSSANGGATWQTSARATTGDPFTHVLFSVSRADARHGWAVGRAEVIVATSDGGSSWTVQQQGTRDGCLLGVTATDVRHAWAVGYAGNRLRGLILATADGGRTWTRQYSGSDVLSAVAFGDADHGWAVGRTGILATSDGGAHWHMQQEVPSPRHLGAVAFSDARHGWAVGGTGQGVEQPGFVLATSDGGAHWRTQLAGTSNCLNDVSIVDARHGWIVGKDGVLYRTTDGGRIWALIHLNSHWELGAVSFSDARHGWVVVHPSWDLGAVARDSKAGWGLLQQLALLATSDGGLSWEVVQSARGLAPPVILTDVACGDATDSH